MFDIRFILLFYASIWAVKSEEFVFVSLPDHKPTMNNYLTNANHQLRLDASAGFHRYVYINLVKNYDHEFAFECKAKPTSKPIEYRKFCCKKDSKSTDLCSILKETRGQVNCGSLTFDYSTDTFTGLSISRTFKKVNANEEFAGSISCELQREGIIIKSNEIEFRDSDFYRAQLEVKPAIDEYEAVSVFHAQNLPKKFQCLPPKEHEAIAKWPSWMHFMWPQVSPIVYASCDYANADNFNSDACVKGRKEISPADHFIYSDGSLYITNPNFFSPSKVIVCYTTEMMAVKSFVGSFSNRIISSGIPFPENAPDLQNYTLRKLGDDKPETLEVIYGSELKDLSLNAIYETPGGGVDFMWTKNTVRLDGINPYSYKISGIASKDIEGNYRLDVTDAQNSKKKIKFDFYITLVGPPQFLNINCLQSTTYVAQGETYSRSCILNKSPENLFYGVDGYDAETLVELKDKLIQTFQFGKPELINMTNNMHLATYKGATKVEVTITKLMPKQDFRLSLEARNAHGKSLIDGFVKVVRKFFTDIFLHYPFFLTHFSLSKMVSTALIIDGLFM
ncbi:hypothetical protein Ciccas_001859 [Cichlidogyrus casuarinus]|uniref:Uncharacterized protein n=1 Tax=Cichlidogyrus casuarinus TaxID=1844966 RepID=A0ABD2QL49_9PLAT